jgi:hypothetical protein
MVSLPFYDGEKQEYWVSAWPADVGIRSSSHPRPQTLMPRTHMQLTGDHQLLKGINRMAIVRHLSAGP